MANAKKCDRCKKFYDIYDGIPFVNQSRNMYNYIDLRCEGSTMYHRFELCEDCQKALYSFLKNVPDREKEGE